MAAPDAQRYDVVVIGAGFAGLYMTKRMLDLGLTVRAFEAADGVGGTWYWNRYPGARVDLESFDYSYSFSDDLQRDWRWSERYATQPELLRYLNHVADRFDLRPHIELNTRVRAAAFDEACDRWRVEITGGRTVEARYLVSAAGVLSTPKLPEIEGLETFAGKTFHTGLWPHDPVDFKGKRVGFFGTGSSGSQAIPKIVEQAAHVTVFQRTPVYCVPVKHFPITDALHDDAVRTYADRRAKSRTGRYGIPAEFPTVKAFDVSDEERRDVYDKAWGEKGHLLAFRMTFADILSNEAANETVAEFIRGKIREIVEDPDVAEKLCPKGFPFGTKRPILGTAFYEAFNRPNVELVDLTETPVVRITPTGVETTTGLHEFDELVFATGFDALTGAILRIEITGRDGMSLQREWSAGPRAYLGLATHGFPNLFFLTGPLSPGPLSNMSMAIEQHVEWVSACIAHMEQRGLSRIEADADAEEAWRAHVQEVVDGTLYQRANSWYLGANVPGKPRVFIPYLAGHGVYRAKCDEVASRGYEGFTLSSRPEAAGAVQRKVSALA